jgi:hypothetical protein
MNKSSQKWDFWDQLWFVQVAGDKGYIFIIAESDKVNKHIVLIYCK